MDLINTVTLIFHNINDHHSAFIHDPKADFMVEIQKTDFVKCVFSHHRCCYLVCDSRTRCSLVRAVWFSCLTHVDDSNHQNERRWMLTHC